MTIPVTGTFVPAGAFPVVDDTNLAGGYRIVPDIATPVTGRDAIITADRKVGMQVYVQTTGDVYILGPGITNADWTLYGLSGAITPADYTAKGVILVGTGVGTETALSVGVNGLVLTADNTQPTGVKWDVSVPGGGAIPVPSPAIQHLYVSGLNGNDVNDGSAPLLAVATLSRAFALIPYTLSSPLVIHLGAAGAPGVAYAWSPMPTPTQLTADARIWLYGDGAGQAGEDGFVVVAGSPVVAIAGTDENQITTAAIVANAYQGATLEVLTGPAAGSRRTVQSNTTTSILPVRRFETQSAGTPVVPVAGNTIRIVRPSVIFSGYDALTDQPGFLNGVGGGDGNAPLFLINLAFAAPTAQTEINNCTIFGCGVEFRGTTIAPYFVGCRGSFGNWDNIFESSTFQKTLPSSTNLSTAKAGWFADIGLPTALSQLALWRGWGVSQPDITAVTSTSLGIQLLECQMSMFGVFGNLRSNSSTLAVGGWFWGDLQVDRGFLHVLGRAPAVSALLNNTVFSRRLYTELATVISTSGSMGFTYAAAADEAWTSVNSDVSMLGGGVFASAVSSFLKMTGGGFFDAQGAWSVIGVSANASGQGLISVLAGAFYDNASSFVLTNSSDGAGFLASESGIIAGTGPATLTGSGGASSRCISVLDGGSVKNTGAWTCAAGRLEVSNGSYEAAGALTVSGVTGTPLDLTQNASFLQSAGAMSLTSLTASAVSAVDSTAAFSGTTLTLASSSSAIAALTLENSAARLNPATLLFTLGGIDIRKDSNLLIDKALAITGHLVALWSKLITLGNFSTTLATTVDASTCMHFGATTSYNILPGQTADILRSSLQVSTNLTFGSGLTTFEESELLTSTFGSTTFNGDVTCLLSDLKFMSASTTVILGALTFTDSNLSHQGDCTLSGAATGENSNWFLDAGSLVIPGVFSMVRCEIYVNGDFTNPSSVSLVDTEMSVSGIYSCAGTSSVARSSQLVISADTVGVAMTVSNASRLVCSTDVTLTGVLTGTNSEITISGRLLSTGLVLTKASHLYTQDFLITPLGAQLDQSTWIAAGSAAVCTLTSTTALVSGLEATGGSVVDWSGLTGVATLRCPAVGGLGFFPAGALITEGSVFRFNFNKVTVLGTAGNSNIGMSLVSGGMAWALGGVPTTIDGILADFVVDAIDGPFPKNQLSVAANTRRTVQPGQITGAAYFAVFPRAPGFITCT